MPDPDDRPTTGRSPRPHPPSVERVLAAARAQTADRDPAAVVAVARAVVDKERARLAGDDSAATARDPDDLGREVAARLDAFEHAMGPARVINATGVIVHTNLGRAPWPAAAIRAAASAAEGTLFLELDRETGRRGRRYREAEAHLIALTGAEDALIVVNNAAAVAVTVGLAGRGGVAVSRGELVEIGGGVRIPEIVKRAGARLVEVGTTNRTRVADFEDALADGRARLVLRVHPSNFNLAGFVEAPDAPALAAAAHRHGALVVDDLGSGALLDTAAFGLGHEPMPSERLADGADLVTFSGDKLVGGPQAGFIVGRADLVARLRKDPLARAMRPDKVLLVAVAATLALYRAGVAQREIPVWRQISAPVDRLEARARAIAAAVGAVATVSEVESTIGGGSMPGQTLPSRAVCVTAPRPDALLSRLRAGSPAVVGRIERGAVVLDARSVEPDDDAALASALRAALDHRD